MNKTTTATFGTSEFRSHPGEPLDPADQRLAGMLCYFLEDYGEKGPAVHIERGGGELVVRIGDWSGYVKDMDENNDFVRSNTMAKLLEMHSALRLVEAYYFLSKSLKLVDLQVSDHKFASPGFITELYSAPIGTLRVVSVERLTPESLVRATSEGCKLVKPAVYRNYEEQVGVYKPMYARVR